MNNLNQKTIKKNITISGLGIHSGTENKITFLPAKAKEGIKFLHKKYNKIIKVSPENLIPNNRATIFMKDNVKILTPEHLLATLYAFGIDNILIEVENDEIPIMDGSAIDFVMAIKQAGIIDLDAPKKILKIKQPIAIKQNDKSIIVIPDENFKITFLIEYSQKFIDKQILSLIITPISFETEIAKARTYGFISEIEELLAKNQALGANIDNAVVIGEKGFKNKLRFKDELVRHKILDLIGDLASIGHTLQGHFIAIKTGHSFNASLIKKIANLI